MNSGKILLYLFLALVVLAPLPLGGNNPTAWTIDAFCAGILVSLFSLQNLLLGQNPPVPFRKIAVPATLFTAVCLWALIQSLSITPTFLHHPLWSAASDALGESLSSAISVNPYETRTALMRLMTYGAVFWLALQLGRDRVQASQMLKTIGYAIAAYALYGLVLWSAGSDTILWYDKWAYHKSLTSTFINRNSFATFVGLGCVIFLALFTRSLRKALRSRDDDRMKHRIQRFMDALYGKTSLYLLALLITIAALFLTNSRAGTAFSLVAMAILLGITMMKNRVGFAGLLAVLFACLTAFILLFDLGGNRLAERLSRQGAADEGRGAVYQRTIEAISDQPWLGTGYGTFRDVFPMYRDDSISSWGIWDKAHNTYLENMMELGMPAALALFLAVAACVWICLRGISTRRRDSHFAIIGFSASVLVALHALVDFSLQIPGMAICYAALLGLCCAQSWSSRA